METKNEISRRTVKWAAGLFILCSFLIFCGAYKLGIKGFESMGTKATEIAALQQKIKVLAGRINDEESGEYYRRIAVMIGGDASPGAVKTYKAVSRLNGTISNERRELEEAREHLARLIGGTYHEGFSAPATDNLRIARLAGRAN